MVVHKDIHNSYPAGSNPFEGGGASAGTFGDEASIVKENADRNADRIFVEDVRLAFSRQTILILYSHCMHHRLYL